MDIKPVLIHEDADNTDFSVLCMLGMSDLSFIFALSSLCIQGNRCPNGSATGKVNNVQSSLLTMIVGMHKHQRLSNCCSKRIRIHL